MKVIDSPKLTVLCSLNHASGHCEPAGECWVPTTWQVHLVPCTSAPCTPAPREEGWAFPPTRGTPPPRHRAAQNKAKGASDGWTDGWGVQ